MTMITGLYPHQHGIAGNDPPATVDRGAMLKHVERAQTLPKILARHGYASFQSGKWWEGHFANGGFTDGMTHGDVNRGGRHGDEGLKIGRQGLKPIFDFIDGCGERPFFLWYAPMMPHTPHTPPERILKTYLADDRPLPVARYYAMCQWWDETCGQLLDYLEQKNLADNTLVVYVTDNGWIQNPNSNAFAPRSKRSPYEGGVRTPIMFRLPGKIEPRREEMSPASTIDLVPTILAACGFERPANLPGIDLLAQSRLGVFGEIFEHDVADLDHPQASLQYRWSIEGDWKLILPRDGKHAELFNVKNDPAEKHDLAATESDRVRDMTARLGQWWPLD
jgi:uncharacterized sulfatase